MPSKSASPLFAKTHLDQKIGSFFAKAFERTSIGCDGALEILNRVSPEYADMLKGLIDRFGNEFAEVVSEKYETEGINGVQERIDSLKSGSEPGKTQYDNINIDELKMNEPAKLTEIIEDIRTNGGSPISIPDDATIIPKSMNKGYQQIKYQWSNDIYKFEARWHTETPAAVQYDRGTTWVVTRTIPGNAQGQQRITEYLVGNQWIIERIWRAAESANITGIAIEEQMKILENGHWQAK